MDRGGWQATVHRVAESDRTERLSLSHLPGTRCSHLGQNGEQGNDLTLTRTNKETRNNEDFSQDYCRNQEAPKRTVEQRTGYLIR